MIMVLAFSGFAIADDQKIAELKAQDIQSQRQTIAIQDVTTSNTNLDELIAIYETTFENADGWTIIDNLDDGNTWQLISSNDNTTTYFEDNAPFMWVDSDIYGGTAHMIETLVSPTMDAGTYSYVYVSADLIFDNVTNDSMQVLFTTDGGTNWTEIARYTSDFEGYPALYDISDLAVGESSFQIAFHYDDDDGCMWYAGVDNFAVFGSDTPGDFEAPEVEITSSPDFGFEGVDQVVVASATDDVGVEDIDLVYGLVVNMAVPTTIVAPMTLTENADEYSAVIPGDYAAVGDTVAFLVTVSDAEGNTTADPSTPGDAYIYKVFSLDESYSFTEIPYSFTDISATGAEIANGDSETDYLDFTTIDGIDSFDWYGETYTELSVNTNGWIAFGHSTNLYSGLTIPSTTTPNAVLAALEDDWDSDETNSGRIVWELVDGKLIIQYGSATAGVFHWNKTFGPTFQIILDPSSNTATVNYMFVELMDGETAYTGDHLIGCENATGELGYVLYDGTDYVFPANETSYLVAPPLGGIEGVVTQGTASDLAANVTVEILDGEEVVSTATTGDDGVYSIMLPNGTYDIQFTKTGYETLLQEDVVVADEIYTTVDVNLDEETTVATLSGVIYDAETDAPINGIVVELVEVEMSMTTGTDGAYSFADVAIGNYTIEINAEIGLATFHDLTADVTIAEAMDPVDFEVNTIMTPENVQPLAANTSVLLTFDAPANHAAPEIVMSYINELELIVYLHDNNEKIAENIVDVREQLAIYRNIYANLTEIGSSLDEISDFAGYRIELDGTLQNDVYPSESITVSGLTNDQEYTFAVAADYGYGDEFLIFTADVTATPAAPDPYRYETTTYNWIEIRTNDLGTRVPWTADDDYSGMIDFPEGLMFTFYGTLYTSFNIGSNGYFSFVEEDDFGASCPWTNELIPDNTTPNGYVAPHWDWLEIDDDDAYSAYYHFDADNDQIVVTWYAPEWGLNPTGNLLEFQAVLNLETNEIIFNYNSASDHWTESVTVGIENQDGTIGLSYDDVPMSDGAALLFTQAPEILGTISGTVKHENTSGYAIEDVEVWVDGRREAMATTDDNGDFTFTIAIGTYDLLFVHDDYWTVNEDDVVVTEGNDTDIDEVYMTQPEASASPSSLDISHNLFLDTPTTATFDLENIGSGPMEYVASITIASDINHQMIPTEPRELGHIVENDMTAKVDEDQRGPVLQAGSSLDEVWDVVTEIADVSSDMQSGFAYGVALIGNNFYVTECSTGEFAKFSTDGTFISTAMIPNEMVPTTSTWLGLNDLASDPSGYLYGTNDDGKVFRFLEDLTGVTELGDVDCLGISLAYDFDNSAAYVSEWGDPFYRIDDDGSVTTLTSCPGSAYGMTYVHGDPDGYTIYAHVDNGTEAVIVRYNPTTDTWETDYIFETFELVDGIPGGIDAGFSDAGRLDFIALQQDDPNDPVTIWEGYPYSLQQWLTLSPAEGTILSGASQQMTITVNPSADPEFAYQAEDEVTAYVTISGPHMNDVTVLVDISFFYDGAEEVAGVPQAYALHQNYPNPFNPSTEIKFDLVQPQSVKLVVFNTLGQEVVRLVDAPMQAGYHVVTFDASTLASGVYFYRIETEAFTSMKKMIMVK